MQTEMFQLLIGKLRTAPNVSSIKEVFAKQKFGRSIYHQLFGGTSGNNITANQKTNIMIPTAKSSPPCPLFASCVKPIIPAMIPTSGIKIVAIIKKAIIPSLHLLPIICIGLTALPHPTQMTASFGISLPQCEQNIFFTSYLTKRYISPNVPSIKEVRRVFNSSLVNCEP
jgi:hypothetical protein